MNLLIEMSVTVFEVSVLFIAALALWCLAWSFVFDYIFREFRDEQQQEAEGEGAWFFREAETHFGPSVPQRSGSPGGDRLGSRGGQETSSGRPD